MDLGQSTTWASETDRSSDGLLFEQLGQPVEFGVNGAITHYANSKLALLTFATELGRKLTTARGALVAVHGLCPGPIASRITRDARPMLEPVIDAAMRRLFQTPEETAFGGRHRLVLASHGVGRTACSCPAANSGH